LLSGACPNVEAMEASLNMTPEITRRVTTLAVILSDRWLKGAKIVCDRITEFIPAFGDFVA